MWTAYEVEIIFFYESVDYILTEAVWGTSLQIFRPSFHPTRIRPEEVIEQTIFLWVDWPDYLINWLKFV